MIKKILSLILWILVFQLIGYFLGMATQSNINTWYPTLIKSSLNPPDMVFPIVWTILYVMLAVAGWSLWQNRKEARATVALIFYSVQMLMNFAWSPIFFQFHLLQLGFYWIVGMIFFTAITILISLKHYKLPVLMLLPYLVWIMFASYLNWDIWMKNS